jgi:monoamine oxidase
MNTATKKHNKKQHIHAHAHTHTKKNILKIKKKGNVKMVESDILCVGAGVSSAYMCYQLKEHGIHSKINVIELTDVIGGRLKSVYSNVNGHEKVTYEELGAMRIFKTKSMEPIFDLIKKFNIETVDVSLDDKNNIFFYKNKIMKKSDVHLNNGMTIKEFEDLAITNFKKKHPDFTVENAYDFDETNHMNLSDFLIKYADAKKEDIDLWFAYNGYDKLEGNSQVSLWLFDKDLYSSKYSAIQQYIKTGIVTIAKKLFQHSNARITYNTKVIYIEKDEHGLNIVHTMNTKNQYICYKCKYLVLGITPYSLNQLNTIHPIPIAKKRLQLIKHIKHVPLFKCFLKWDKDKVWWGPGTKYKSGKSVTDQVLRQVHYYNYEDILIYNSGKYATKLYKMFSKNPAKTAKYLYYCIQKMHPFPIPEPNYVYTIYKYWIDGSTAWQKNVDVNEAVYTIPNGNMDNSHIYIVGDSYSKFQGWIIGSMISVDIALPLLLQNMSE